MNEQESTMSTTTEGSPSLPLREKAWFKLLIGTLYSIIFVLGVAGNAAVCIIICRRKKLKTVTNLFILNLAISDLIFSGSIPLEFPIILSNTEWPYASFFCKIYGPGQTIVMSVSIFTLTAVSITRYHAITHPFRHQVLHCHAKYILTGIWIFSTLLMIPHFLTLKMKEKFCDEEWPDDSYRKIYTIFLFVFFYIIPLFIIIFTYTKIVRELSKKKNYQNTALDEARDVETSKVVRMFIKVTFVFAICNLPSQLMWLWLDFGNAEEMLSNFWDLLAALNILIFANSAANPFIYYRCHDRFRSEARAYLNTCNMLTRLKRNNNQNSRCLCKKNSLWPEKNVQECFEMTKIDRQRASLTGTSIQLIPRKLGENNQDSYI